MNHMSRLLRANNEQWNRRIFIFLAVIYTALIADISIANIADFSNVISFAISIWGIALFVSIVVVSVAGLCLIPRYLMIPRESEYVFSSKVRFSYIIHTIQ